MGIKLNLSLLLGLSFITFSCNNSEQSPAKNEQEKTMDTIASTVPLQMKLSQLQLQHPIRINWNSKKLNSPLLPLNPQRLILLPLRPVALPCPMTH